VELYTRNRRIFKRKRYLLRTGVAVEKVCSAKMIFPWLLVLVFLFCSWSVA
jgi:hypothetical protein